MIKKRPIILSECDRTGNAVRPWAEAGWECWCVDTQHSIRKRMRGRVTSVGEGTIRYIWGDVRSWVLPGDVCVAFYLAFPPCTHLTCSGAQDWQTKRGYALADALQTFDACERAAAMAGCPYAIENPALSRLSTNRRSPDHTFHPWEYAGYLPDHEVDNTEKRTGLWSGAGFVMPSRKPAPAPHRQDCWRASPGDDRADDRAETPMGFARAVYEANSPLLAAAGHQPTAWELVAG